MRFTNEASRKWTRSVERQFELQDLRLRRQFRDRWSELQELEALAAATGICDRELLRRLRALELRSSSVEALTLFPIAMAAWASGTVTPEERRLAEQALEESDIADNPAATKVYRGWLQRRPDPRLWKLWHDFTVSRRHALPVENVQRTGRAVWDAANRVATASGGLWGLGAICPAEQVVLEEIRQAHAL